MTQRYPKQTKPEKPKTPLPAKIKDARKKLEEVFAYCDDVLFNTYRFGSQLRQNALTVHCATMIRKDHVNVLNTAMSNLTPDFEVAVKSVRLKDLTDFFEHHGVATHQTKLLSHYEEVETHILSGNFVILFDGWNKAVSFEMAPLQRRQVAEPVNETVVKGPHEGTVENLQTNLGLLRQRLMTSDFKIETLCVGDDTNTQIAYGYLEKAVNPEVLHEFKNRIQRVAEGQPNILDTSYIEELIEDSSWSPFPQHRYTERPDTAAASLLEGKIVVLVQGSPSILICPAFFVELMQSAEDYYHRTVISSLIRVLRIFAFFIALVLPSLYIALSTFHPELIPTVLLLAMIDTREGIPFPALVEALIMEFFFELLREAGVRLPRPVGSAVSIVGALIIGEAAINAGIASPIMVVIVALTGIASFSLPQYEFAIALRILRFPLMLISSMLGGFGLLIGMLWILLHMMSLRTLGQPYMSPLGPTKTRQLRDVLIRTPLKDMVRNPRNRHMHRFSGKSVNRRRRPT